MRFHITTEFAETEQAWRDAYAAHDAFAEAGDDGAEYGGTQAATDASAREYQTLRAVTHFPACTPVEVQRKLHIITSDRLRELSLDDLATEMAQIQRDLVNLQRPCTSPRIDEAFEAFAKVHDEWMHSNRDGDLDDDLCERHSAAMAALHETPCTTPGDFLVKAFVEVLDDNGNTFQSHLYPAQDIGNPFMISTIDGETLDDDYARGARQDLLDCDLGLCLMMLGQTDFDAEAWIQTARRIGHGFWLVINEDGSRSFGQDCTGSEDCTRLMQLVAYGQNALHRSDQVADAIEARHHDRLTRHDGPRGTESALAAANKIAGLKNNRERADA